MEEGESVKLFVGQVPKHMTESEISALFREFARVDEVSLIRDKVTRASRGCCFVMCPSREEADKAVDACHNKKTLPGASSPLQVKYADGEFERLENKLFVGMLPKNVSDTDVAAIFSEFGTIKELHVLGCSLRTNKGCAFLKFETKEQALAAIEATNGKHKMKGSTVPLVVKWADTAKERDARMAQKSLSLSSNASNIDSSQNCLYGAIPMGYLLSYNGHVFQTPGHYRFMPYFLPSVQNRNIFHNLIQPLNQGNSEQGITSDISSSMASRSYAKSSNAGLPSIRHRIHCHPMHSAGNNTLRRQSEGPPGANLFIYHIPQELNDDELAKAFQRFGRVLSAKVFVDKATGLSKCFGFVSYDSPVAAQTAINAMNGFQLGGKKLKVQLKRNHKQNKL